MFEKKNSLPGPKLHPPFTIGMVSLLRVNTMRICDGMSSAPSESCSKYSAFSPAPVDRKIFRDRAVQLDQHFHHGQAATGVLRENCNNAVFNFALAHERFDLVGDFVSAFSCCCDGEMSV